MAIGDAALAAGMEIVDGATTLASDIDREINRSRDYIAERTGSTFRGVSNLSASKAARLRAMLAAAHTGGMLLPVAWVGDSTTAGLGGTPGITGVPEVFAQIADEAGYAVFGEPMAMANRSIAPALESQSSDARIDYGDGWETHAATSPVGENSTTADPLVFNATTVERRLRVYLTPTSGPVTIRIDGSIIPTSAQASALTGCTYDDGTGTLTVNPGASGLVGAAFSTPVDSATHSLSVARVSGTAQVTGFDTAPVPLPSAGIRTFNFGFGSARASHMIGSGGTYPHDYYVRAYGAELVFLNLAINDAINTTTISTYKTQMQTEINNLTSEGALLILVIPQPVDSADLAPYAAAIYELAADNDLPVIDLNAIYDQWSTLNDYGLMSDSSHPSSLGYRDIAHTIARAVGVI